MAKSTEVTITEIAEFEPERVDGVGKGANGFPILMLKSIDGESATVVNVTTEKGAKDEDMATILRHDKGHDDWHRSHGDEPCTSDADCKAKAAKYDDAEKAGSDRQDCPDCKGTGGDDGKCPKCLGSGIAPNVGETAKEFIHAAKEAGVAASGSGATPAIACPTCHGDGIIGDWIGEGAATSKRGAQKQCPDCGGTGLDEATVNTVELNAQPGYGGNISIGDPAGREKMDKAMSECKACKCMNKGDASYCSKCGGGMTKGHGIKPDGFRPADYMPDADETVECPKCERMNDLDAAYCDQCGHTLAGDDDVEVGTKADGASFTATNPALTSATGMLEPMNAPADETLPGSKAWEAIDAQVATPIRQA